MMTPLKDIATVSGGFPFRKKVQPEEGADLALVQIKDIDGGEGVSAIGTVMLRSGSAKYERYLLQCGDLLFQSRGSRHPVAIVGEGLRGIAAAGVHVIRADVDRVLPTYLAWWLNHPQSQARMAKDLAHGTHIPFISRSDLEAFHVPLPPLATQEKVARVWELQKRSEMLTTKLNELNRQLTDAITLSAATEHN